MEHELRIQERTKEEDRLKNEELERKLSKYPSHIQDLIKNKQIQIGMTNGQVLLSWGEPYKINKSVSSHGEHTKNRYMEIPICILKMAF